MNIYQDYAALRKTHIETRANELIFAEANAVSTMKGRGKDATMTSKLRHAACLAYQLGLCDKLVCEYCGYCIMLH